MNNPNPDPQRDEEIDTLLARRYHDTTPEFEARWVALKRELRNTPVRRPHGVWPVWNRWVVIASVAAVIVILAAVVRRHEVTSSNAAGEIPPALAELFAMDAVLGRATALLEAENREALLNLPVPPKPRT